MRVCPKCGESYAETIQFCPLDGTGLAESTQDDPRVGTMVDRYRLIARLGEGGMGIVYRAEHTIIGRPVALKLLHPNLTAVSQAVERFFREARAAGEVATEHIVNITDSGRTEDGTSFLVMELLLGQSLERLLDQETTLPPTRAVHIGLQIADALAAAHVRSVIHRDLKPANVQLVERDGNPDFVKLLDFGVAKMVESNVKLTQTGMIVGSPAYMSPEQASGKTVDQRTDIYAFGVMLFEMLTGRPPFVGVNATEVLLAHVMTEPPTPRSLNPLVPEALESIIMACLAKDPEHRPRSMAHLRERLLGWQGTAPTLPAAQITSRPLITPSPTVSDFGVTGEAASAASAPDLEGPSSVPGRRRSWIILALVVLVIAAGVAAAVLLPRRETRTATAVSPDAAMSAVVDSAMSGLGPDLAVDTVGTVAHRVEKRVEKRSTPKRTTEKQPTTTETTTDDHTDDHRIAARADAGPAPLTAAEERKRHEAEIAARRKAEQARIRREELKAHANVELQTRPTGARVFFQEQALGITPLSLATRPARSVRVQLVGYRAVHVAVGPDTRSPLVVQLQPLGDPGRSLSRLEDQYRTGRINLLAYKLRRMQLIRQRDAELAEARQRYRDKFLTWEAYRRLIDQIQSRYR